MAKIKDIAFERGEDVLLRVTLDREMGLDQAAFAATFRASKTETDDIAPLLQLVSPASIILTDTPEDRFIDVVISAAASASFLPDRQYYYDVKRVDAGNNAVLVKGVASIGQPATRIFSL